MAKFIYKAYNTSGKIIKGTVQEEDKQAVYIALKARGLQPLDISAVKDFIISTDLLTRWNKVSQKDILFFIMQLSTMVKAGTPLILSLKIIINQIKNKKFKKILTDIKTDISRGKNLSDACLRYPQVFPPIFSNIIKAGEESGKLELILDRYAEFIKNNNKIASEIKGAMIYPLILIGLSIVMIFFLTTFIVPKFAEILKSTSSELPITTKFLLNFSAFMQNNYLYILIGMIVFIVAFLKYIRTDKGRYIFDVVKLKLPLIGNIIFKTAISRFVRTMSTLLASGVPFLKNLKLAINIINNKAISKKLETITDSISRGKSIANQFQSTGLFTPVAIQMINIGEKSGTLAKMFDEIADYYDREIEGQVKRLTTALEPLVLIFVAVVIGFIAVSLVSSMMKAISSFK